MIGVGRLNARFDFVKSSRADHGGIVAGKLRSREENREGERRMRKGGLSSLAESLISRDATSDNERFGFGIMFESESEFFN